MLNVCMRVWKGVLAVLAACLLDNLFKKSIWHWIIHSGDSNSDTSLYEVRHWLIFDLKKCSSNEYIFLKDLSNEHFVRTPSKLHYFVKKSWSPIYKKKLESQFIQNVVY